MFSLQIFIPHINFTMKYIYKFILLLGILFFANVEASERHALVIGNAEYKFGALKNPINDATDVADTLRKYSFNVTLLTNAYLSDIQDKLDSFVSAISTDRDIGLIYYAGHGIQFGAENYLLPTDVSITSATSLKNSSLPLNELVRKLDSANNKLNLVILDSCRNNPFKRVSHQDNTRSVMGKGQLLNGLAPLTTKVGNGIVFWYATRPGDVALDGEGRNSPFSKYLLEVINNHPGPARTIISKIALRMNENQVKQQPWQEGIWLSDFSFNMITDRNTKENDSTYDASKDELYDFYSKYIRNCKEHKNDCAHLDIAQEQLSLREKMNPAEPLISSPKETKTIKDHVSLNLDRYQDLDVQDALGRWQCSWQDNKYDTKGTTITDYYKLENSTLFAKSKVSFCPREFKWQTDDLNHFTVRQPRPCAQIVKWNFKYRKTPIGQNIAVGTYRALDTYGGYGTSTCIQLYKQNEARVDIK